MEQVLLKLARQLDSIDEASLLVLWEEYVQRVTKFEPTKRWEEAVLVLGLIQAKHWKNQLFNQQYSAHVRPEFQGKGVARPFGFSLEKSAPKQQATILQFIPRQSEAKADADSASHSSAAPDEPDTEYDPNQN